jgi:hypothetical protein
VDPVPDPLLFRIALGIEPGTYGSIARNSDHYTIEKKDDKIEKIEYIFTNLAEASVCMVKPLALSN